MNILIPVLSILAILIFLVILLYNRLARQRIMVREGWSGIGTFLQQRNDLIPNLVETVKGYALHESGTLAEVIRWRNKAVQAGTAAEKIDADNGMQKALVEFFALAEQYPDLKANQNFLGLQQDLKEMETKINQSRRYYNATVRTYNQSIAVFPSNMVAGVFGFREENFLEEEPAAKQVPQVSFK